MTGIMCALIGGNDGRRLMTAAAASSSSGKTTTYYTGYTSGLTAVTLISDFGFMANKTFGASTVMGLYHATTVFGGNGTVYIYVSGNRSAGFISSVTSNGTSLGTVGAPSYNSGIDATVFQLGGASVANPFVSGNTYNIVMT